MTVDIQHAALLLLGLQSTGQSESSTRILLIFTRLYKRRGRFWADDVWAMIASLALVLQVVGVFLHVIVQL